MTTTISRRPETAQEHAAEARRLLTLVRPTGLTDEEREETYAYENAAGIIAAAHAHIALAQLEEQRTANLIAADRLDSIVTPYDVGTPEYHEFWRKHGQTVTERVGLSR